MLRGDVTPVFFGSAVTNFGVELFLDAFVGMGPPPASRVDADAHVVEPTDPAFSGFVFKIQANMDPRHRDRVAFLRVCSGTFSRDMTVRNVRTGKDVRLTRAMKLFAADRESVDIAFAGDVVGLANPGVFAIGDTLTEGEGVRFEPIPGVRTGTFCAGAQYGHGDLQIVSKGHRAIAGRGSDPSVLSLRADAHRTDPRRGRCSAI